MAISSPAVLRAQAKAGHKDPRAAEERCGSARRRRLNGSAILACVGARANISPTDLVNLCRLGRTVTNSEHIHALAVATTASLHRCSLIPSRPSYNPTATSFHCLTSQADTDDTCPTTPGRDVLSANTAATASQTDGPDTTTLTARATPCWELLACTNSHVDPLTTAFIWD